MQCLFSIGNGLHPRIASFSLATAYTHALLVFRLSLCWFYLQPDVSVNNILRVHRRSTYYILTDKMKRSFFQAAVVSILLYGCTCWTLTKRLEKKLDCNYTRMLRAILNKSWRQHPTRYQLYGHLPPITKTIQARRTRHVGQCWRRRDELMWCTPMDPRI